MVKFYTIRATPLVHDMCSPSELLNGRVCHTLIPVKQCPINSQQEYQLLHPKLKSREKYYLDQHAREYSELKEFEKMHVQLDPDRAE